MNAAQPADQAQGRVTQQSAIWLNSSAHSGREFGFVRGKSKCFAEECAACRIVNSGGFAAVKRVLLEKCGHGLDPYACKNPCLRRHSDASYSPRTRHATNRRPKPRIHDQVANGSGILSRPKWATTATKNKTSDITQTAMVGALPELRITNPLVFKFW